MGIQFLIEGIKRGEKGIYMTFEEKKERTFDDMRSFGWNLKKYEDSGDLAFLEYTPEQVRKIISEGGGEIETLIEKSRAKRLVIDSMTSFALLYKDELARKEAALFLFELIHKWQCTALLTDQAIEEGELFSQIGFEVDSIIILYHTRAKGIRKRGLEILKMRGTRIPQKTFPFDVGSKGIVLNTGGVFDL
jgi:circadian clock protein KaiC